MWRKKLVGVLFAVLIVACAALVALNLNLQNQLRQDGARLEQDVLNGQVLAFMQAFVDKVLRAKGEVSFDDRLQLENMVRGLHDSAILAEWEKFVNSRTPAVAQEEVKNLLELLVYKMRTL